MSGESEMVVMMEEVDGARERSLAAGLVTRPRCYRADLSSAILLDSVMKISQGATNGVFWSFTVITNI